MPPDPRSLSPTRLHRQCVVCGSDHPFGLRLRFDSPEPGSVRTEVTLDARWTGYAALVHGGVAASVLDGAMTHALFSLGITAVTATLNLRYHRPLREGVALQVEARHLETRHGLYRLESSIHQRSLLCVSAEAKFMKIASDSLLADPLEPPTMKVHPL